MDSTCIPVLFTVNVIPVSRHSTQPSDSDLRLGWRVCPRPLSTVPIVWSRVGVYLLFTLLLHVYRMEGHAAAGSGISEGVDPSRPVQG